ncbi:hypothetical protein ACFC96_40950 [Streptomyces sp. NPDC055955]|uniref:hypothetical protein n=1 Tax=Streptomyces sp. NPDC055955 TaxID=3345665 RepID=UPI0035DDF6B0
MAEVIYLDQNHWVTMARARVAPEKIQGAEERRAAEELWELAAKKAVRLPLSSAHLVETAHAGTKERRHDLARAMLEAYDGWHMLSPLVVRLHEFAGAFSGRKLTAEHVFTNAPQSPFSNYPLEIDSPDAAAPTGTATLGMTDVVWRATWASLLLEESLPQDEQEAINTVVAGWADAASQLAQGLREHPAERDMRLVAAAYMLNDLKMELAQAGQLAGHHSPAETLTFLQPEKVVEFFSRLPFTGRVLEVLQARLRNASDVWVNNDLNDLYFLACAAGYADHVVAEKKTGTFLQSADKALGAPRASVHLNLRSLVGALKSSTAGI